jgi:DNA replication protein DnaC
VRGRFVDFTSLVHRIQSTFDPGSDASKHEVLDPITDCEVLVLDELGAQQPTEWVNNTLYLILNTRYTRQLTTLFTTNFWLDEEAREPNRGAQHRSSGAGSYEQEISRPAAPGRVELLSKRVPMGLVSRLCEMAETVEISVEDYRREVKMQRHAR